MADREEILKQAVDALSYAVNTGVDKDELASAILADHRTLIQLKADVFIRFFRKLAKDYEDGFYDERDEAAGKRAVIIRDALNAAGIDYDGMPFI